MVNNKIRSYQFMFILYPESQQGIIDYVKDNFPCAWALHDKGTYSKAEFLRYAEKHGRDCP